MLLGKAFRDFEEKTCPAFETRELKREAEARQRRQAKTPNSAGNHASTTVGSTLNTEASTPCNRTPTAVGGSSNAGAALASSSSSTSPSSMPANPSSRTSTATKYAKYSGKKLKNQKETTAFGRLVGRRKKAFNRRTYKNHSLGDYVRMIKTLGTTDSYSTEGVCIHPFPA